MQSFLSFLGRAFLSLIFIVAAVHTMIEWSGTETFVAQTFNAWASLAIDYPWVQQWVDFGLAHVSGLLLVASLLQLVGGLLVFLGLSPRLGAFLLFVFIVPTTILCHHFWNMAPPQNELEMQSFMRNLSIAGGLLLLMVSGGRKEVKKPDPK
ncbi:MAG: hypothetical protein RLZZ453_1126 [Chlamydiota bacterium]